MRVEPGCLAPIVIFVYNRPDHTKRLLNMLSNCEYASESEVHIFSDGKKDGDLTDSVEKVRQVIRNECIQNRFKAVSVHEAEMNNGLAKSVIYGISQVITKYGKVIVLEDDLQPSEDFLSYMNGGLDAYQEDQNIWSISGYSFPLLSAAISSKDVYLGKRCCSWGWATWVDRWEKADWEVKEYDAFMKDDARIAQFEEGGKDLTNMLTRQMEGKINSWAIRWGFAQFCNHAYTVFPKYSKIVNGGWDGSGTHCGAQQGIITPFTSYYYGKEKQTKFETLKVNPLICWELALHYNPDMNWFQKKFIGRFGYEYNKYYRKRYGNQ